jgi:hypothetical protein
MELDVIISYDVNDLQQVSIYDGSNFPAPESVTDINGVRILFETVNSVADISNATTCIAWTEYEVLSGTAVANGVSYATGSTMLFAANTTPTGTFTMTTTGRYGQYISTNLPSTGTPWQFTPTQTGRTPYNTLYFADEVFTANVFYYDTIVLGGSNLISGRTYLAVNATTQNTSVVVAGTKTIRVGETYTATGAEAITASSGTYMVEFYESQQFCFTTLYQSFKIWESYLAAKAVAVSPDDTLDSNFLAVAALYGTSQVAAQTTEGIDLTGLQVNIDRILNYYSVQI